MPPNAPQMPGPPGGYGPAANQPMQPITTSSYKPKRSWGWIIAVVLLSVALIGSLVFGFWAFGQMNDYKNNVEPKIEAAKELATKETETRKDKEFVDKEKKPYRTYKSSDILGSVGFEYPKTWSAYIVEDQNVNSNAPVDGFLHPSYVPGKDTGTAFALRLELKSQQYTELLNQFNGKATQGKVKIQPYSPPKVPSIVGVKITGEIDRGKQSTMVLLPLREKTLQISTESPQFLGDFENIILPSLTFAP
ncbi:MAG: hypothetical protein U0451_01345 [Candidatus Saccharimonadales bacterium]